jgi:hypothetical protein
MSTTQTKPKGKQCTRCGHTIYWNNNSGFFEDLEHKGYQHCCPLTCNKEGCGGTIYFSNVCPKNPDTGRAIPLDFPVPQINPKDSTKMIWIIHVHKNNIPAETAPTVPPAPPEIQAITKPDPGQATLEYTPQAPAVAVEQPPAAQNYKPRPELVAEVQNQDVTGTLIKAVGDISQRLGELERLTNEDLVPAIKELNEVMNAIVPKLQVIVGKIAQGSITSASDLVQHNLSQ